MLIAFSQSRTIEEWVQKNEKRNSSYDKKIPFESIDMSFFNPLFNRRFASHRSTRSRSKWLAWCNCWRASRETNQCRGRARSSTPSIRSKPPASTRSTRTERSSATHQSPSTATCQQAILSYSNDILEIRGGWLRYVRMWMNGGGGGYVGTTEIGHDSQGGIDVDDCTEPGCFQRAVNYNASVRQMTALSRHSKDCIQPFQLQVPLCLLPVGHWKVTTV